VHVRRQAPSAVVIKADYPAATMLRLEFRVTPAAGASLWLAAGLCAGAALELPFAAGVQDYRMEYLFRFSSRNAAPLQGIPCLSQRAM